MSAPKKTHLSIPHPRKSTHAAGIASESHGETSTLPFKLEINEHPARVEWQFARGAKEPEEKAPGEYRFRMEVAPNAAASLPIEEVRTLATTYELSNLNEDQIGVFVKQGTITGEMAEALKKIAAQKAVVAKLEEEMENRQKDIDRIVEDQGRLRENMKALRGSAASRRVPESLSERQKPGPSPLRALNEQLFCGRRQLVSSARESIRGRDLGRASIEAQADRGKRHVASCSKWQVARWDTFLMRVLLPRGQALN
jgi:hypothetical protein